VKSAVEIRSPDTPLTGLILAVDPIASGSHLMKVHGPMDRLPWTHSTVPWTYSTDFSIENNSFILNIPRPLVFL
jgi:hypothetical protein